MVSLLTSLPDTTRSRSAALRSLLLDACDRLSAQPGPDAAELSAIVHALREAYERAGSRIPSLDLQLRKLLASLRDPQAVDTADHARQLSRIATWL